MGYTHYAYLEPRKITDDEWNNLSSEVAAISLSADWTDKKVILSENVIQVQGNHEWFQIPRDCSTGFSAQGKYFTFTKTARKDYDYIIVACYMALYRCVDGVKLSSDGDWYELSNGRVYYSDMFLNGSSKLTDEIFENTIHDPRPEWYVGDPCYAINEHYWQDFCNEVNSRSHDALEGDGVEFVFRGHKAYVYNSGLGGDGTVKVHGLEFGVDAGLLSVLPAALVSDDGNGGHFVRSQLRPVFDIDTHHFPHVTLTLNGNIAFDESNHTECDYCGEHAHDNDTYTDKAGYITCGCEEEE